MITGLLMAALLAGDPDGVITTARGDVGAVPTDAVAPDAPPLSAQRVQDAAPHGLTTDEQIQRWVSAREPGVAPFEEGTPVDDRKMHGEVSASIGSHDYRGYSAAVSIPIGEEGRLDLRVSQSEGGYFPYGYAPGYGYGGYEPGYGYRSRSIGVGGQIGLGDRRVQGAASAAD